MGTKVRICIIGNGLFSNKVYYPSLCSFKDVEVAGICAFNEERFKQTVVNFNIPKKIFTYRNQ